MIDIQSPTAEIRRGKKDRKIEKRNHRTKNIMALLLHRTVIIIRDIARSKKWG